MFLSGSPVNIDWNFGDAGLASETAVSDTSQTYTYTSIGTFNLTVNISNSKSFKYNKTQVCVQERITDFAITTPLTYVEVDAPSTVNLGMTSGSDYTCTLTFNDGQSDTVVTTDELSTPPNSDYMYTFTSSGDYTITAVCTNGIGSATSVMTTTAVERIMGVSLNPPGAMAGVDFQINVIWNSGSQVALTLVYDNNAVYTEVDEFTRSALSEVMPGTSTGKHLVTVTLTNPVNSVVLDMNFTIEIAITNPLIICDFLNEITMDPPQSYIVIPTYSDVNCYVSMDDGTSVELTVTWGDLSAMYVHKVADGDPWSSDPAPDPISHSFTTPGTCSMSVLVSNAFNSYQMNYIVMVMTSVDNVEINPVSPVAFTPPANVTFTFRYVDLS